MNTREPACQALLALVTSAYAWTTAPSRRLKLWSDVPAAQRPALFQFEGAPETYQWTQLAVPRRTLDIKLFIYFATSNVNPGAPQLNAVMEALDAVLTPSGRDAAFGRNTLGGTCFDAKIKGVPLRDPGDIDSDGLLIVEVEIVL